MKRTILVAVAILAMSTVASAETGLDFCKKLTLRIGGTINEAESVLANGGSLDKVSKVRTTSFYTKSGAGNENLVSNEYKSENVTVEINLDSKNLVSEYSCAAVYERTTNKSGSVVYE